MIEQIPIDKINLEIRDDINLRTYVLLKRARHVWKQWCQGLRQFGLRTRTYEEFLLLYQDIRVNGIKEPIVLQKIHGMYYLEDGAHRLAIARSLGKQTIDARLVGPEHGPPSVFVAKPKRVAIPFHVDQQNPRIIRMFQHIGAKDIENFVDLKLESDVEKHPMKGAAILWPPSNHLWGELLDEIRNFHNILDITEIECTTEEVLQKMTLEFYKSDNVATYKVEAKFPHYRVAPWKFLFVEFDIEDARHRKKRATGEDISMAIEDLKSHIRSNYRGKIPNYPRNGSPDLIIHGGDNEYMTSEMLKVVEMFREHDEVKVRKYE
tara:strand:+ start:4150 stop:5112 length:963 start_codon:yes stop_codon:yes gene_type:complete